MNSKNEEFPDSGREGETREMHGSPPEGNDAAGDRSRRNFIASIGALTFSFAFVGAFGGNASTQQQETLVVIGPRCAFWDEPDPTCPGPDGDCDATQPVTSGRDESCGDGETDECCKLSPAPNSSATLDTDENCGPQDGGGSDQDQACGDCNDDHDSDQNCGNTLADGSQDRDELCGHAHYVGGTEDAACSATQTDEGCGVHDTNYNNSWTDPDQHCTGSNADQNCASSAPDELCNQGGGAYTTSPDEGCNTSGDVDGACGAGNSTNGDKSYDSDESCSSTEIDESCGAGGKPLWLGGGGDTDEHAAP